MVRLVREAIRTYTSEGYSYDERWLADQVYALLEDEGSDNSQFFVLCMSEAKDDLSQWRAYAGGENGVALELRVPLLNPVVDSQAYLVPVCYDDHIKACSRQTSRSRLCSFSSAALMREGR